jgi:hypothetical protein
MLVVTLTTIADVEKSVSRASMKEEQGYELLGSCNRHREVSSLHPQKLNPQRSLLEIIGISFSVVSETSGTVPRVITLCLSPSRHGRSS